MLNILFLFSAFKSYLWALPFLNVAFVFTSVLKLSKTLSAKHEVSLRIITYLIDGLISCHFIVKLMLFPKFQGSRFYRCVYNFSYLKT